VMLLQMHGPPSQTQPRQLQQQLTSSSSSHLRKPVLAKLQATAPSPLLQLAAGRAGVAPRAAGRQPQRQQGKSRQTRVEVLLLLVVTAHKQLRSQQ
jgi:hypothetical protein